MGMADDDPQVHVVVSLANPEATGPALRNRVPRQRPQGIADQVEHHAPEELAVLRDRRRPPAAGNAARRRVDG
jgi:hypothetical protein